MLYRSFMWIRAILCTLLAADCWLLTGARPCCPCGGRHSPRCRPARAAPGRREEPPVSGPREPLTPRQDGGGAPSPLCHQLPGKASFTIRTAALATAVPRHPSWQGWIRASAKASSSSLGRVARRLQFLLFCASADSLQNRMGKAYILVATKHMVQSTAHDKP